jgi:glycosyltransferase involved in cell wall biosynthesis
MVIGIDASRSCIRHKTGTEWYSYHIIRSLIAKHSQQKYVLYAPHNKDFCLSGPSASIKKISWPFPLFWTQGALSLEMARSAPDVLFVPAHTIPLIHPKKTITTIHDIGFLQWKSAYRPHDFFYLDWSTRYALRHAYAIITISEYSKQELVRVYGANPNAIHVIYLGKDDAAYKKDFDVSYAQQVMRNNGIHPPFLLTIGRVDQRKNIGALVRAFELVKKELTDYSLICIGPRGYGGEAILHEMKTSSQKKSIYYKEWMSEQEKIAFLHMAECFVFPSLYEGFGLPIIEAQSCGVPVACSSAAALPEIAGDGALFFSPHDIYQMAQKIIALCTKADIRHTCIEDGFKNSARFSWKTSATQTETLFMT